MAYNTQKPVRFVQDIVDALALYGLASVVSYDVNHDATITVDDRGLTAVDPLIKVVTIAQTASNIQNPVTGLASAVYVPHVIKVGFGKRTQAFQIATLTAVIATDVLVVNGVSFTAVAGVPAADQFQVGIDDTATAANLAAAINASVSVGVAGVVTATSNLHVVTIVALTAGTGGNAITLSTPDLTIVVGGATLTGGADTETTSITRLQVLSEVFPKGTQVEVYEAVAPFLSTDFVDANRVATFRNLVWGNLAQM